MRLIPLTDTKYCQAFLYAGSSAYTPLKAMDEVFTTLEFQA